MGWKKYVRKKIDDWKISKGIEGPRLLLQVSLSKGGLLGGVKEKHRT